MLTMTQRLLLLCFGVLMTGSAFAQNIAIVNGRAVPKARADFFVKEQTRQGQPDSPELQKMVREELINREVMQQEAERKGLATGESVKQQLDLMRQAVVLNALREDFFTKNKPTDGELKSEYDKLKSQFGDKEYRARHILVETEEQAKSLIEQLKKGAKFEDLAKANSTDTGSAQNGGDLDWSTPASYVPEFSAGLAKLEKGKYSDTPVKSSFGHHIIRLDDVRDAKIPAFDEVKAQIAQSLMAQKWRKYQADARAKATVK
ncbi:MAG: peptidylprolyl isomerase [Burkholderiaceae bacterium]|jgi:peptidyl-prolyl cis-trans isomerase C